MRVGSLFSGIGGLDLGMERAGMQPAYQVEIDKTCLRVLATHWPDVRRLGDITAQPSADLAGVDLVCGGFPCQDLSVAGRRKGLAGERSGLWFEFHRVLADTRPRWCVIENVPGLLTSNEGRDFGTLLRGLVELGYGVAWRILDAKYFGVAQRRNRVFIVGSLGNFASVEVLLESTGLPGDSPTGGEARPSIADGTLSRALGRIGGGDDPGANKGGALILDARGNGPGDVANTLTGDHMDRVTDYTPIVAAPLPSRSATGSNLPGRGGEDDENLVTYWDGGDGDDTLDASQIAKGQMMPEKRRFPVVFEARLARNGRGAPEPIAPPLKAESGSTGKGDAAPLLFDRAVRRLTPLECERLQGFPDLWTEGHSDSARYRMIGNAVCVPVAEWIGRRIMEVSDG